MTQPNRIDAEEGQLRLDKFDDIVIPHPRMTGAHDEIYRLALQTRSRIAKNEARKTKFGGRGIKEEELWILPIIGPSGAGKSRVISVLLDAVYSDTRLPVDEIPLLVVTVRSSTKAPRHLQHQILEAYGDPGAQEVLRDRDYSEALVNEAIRRIARKRKTAILVLDEAHNMLAHSEGRMAPLMAKALKSLVNDGIFSIVLAGTDAVRPILTCDPELHSRQKEVVDFQKFGLSEQDTLYFLGFVEKLEAKMVENGIVDRPVGLTADIEACATTYDMSGGIIGVVARIVRLALERSFASGATHLEWRHIAEAFAGWNGALSEPGYDPFSKGMKPTTKAAVETLLTKPAAS